MIDARGVLTDERLTAEEIDASGSVSWMRLECSLQFPRRPVIVLGWTILRVTLSECLQTSRSGCEERVRARAVWFEHNLMMFPGSVIAGNSAHGKRKPWKMKSEGRGFCIHKPKA